VNQTQAIPSDVIEWVRSVFAGCNARVTEKLSMCPNTPEESLDLTWVEHLSHFSSPVALDSEWIVKIESHYLGGLRHFYTWEIADIGVLVFMRLDGASRTSKVALLQSKRLYPDGQPIREEASVDYEIGFARLADPEDQNLSIAFDAEFGFTEASRYQALQRDSEQAEAIDAYEKENRLKVYYQLYNTWSLPYAQWIPLSGYEPPTGVPELGVRVIPSAVVHAAMTSVSERTLAARDLARLRPLPSYGWRLEDFICDELLGCREGDEFAPDGDARIRNLFFRRSGLIAAAIAITIEGPGQAA
jgi:hypothetical protein